MTYYKRIIVILLIVFLLLCSCSKKTSNDESINTTLSIIDYGNLSVEIDQDNHIFKTKYASEGKNICLEGTIFTYDYPLVTNVYKIIPYDEEPVAFYNPIKEWKRVWFQALTLLNGAQWKYNDKTHEYEFLSRIEKNCVIESLTRQNVTDTEQMVKIKYAFPNAVYGDYILKSTYPAIETDLYEIQSVDLTKHESVVIDTIKNRSFDYYVIRRSFNGIIVGTPTNVDLHYMNYDDVNKTETYIFSEDWRMFYDGIDIYEVHNNNMVTEQSAEIYLKDQSVLSFEQALGKAAPVISNVLTDSINRGNETYIYAAELVYLTVQEIDKSANGSSEAYLYPFWVIYIHINYTSAGIDCAYRKPILVNAITGEVVACN